MSVDLDKVRSEALLRIHRGERRFKLALVAAAIGEFSFLGAFILAVDFRDRMHVLLFLATMGSYTLVVLGLVALGAYVNRGMLRVLKAIEACRDVRPSTGGSA